jgi:transcriptional regulator with XRE-family HTH domain
MNNRKPAQHHGYAVVVSGIIRQKRLSVGLSQRDLAGLLGVSPAAVSYYESGKRSPSVATLLKLSSALEFSMRDCITVIGAMSGGQEDTKK